jgi:hypothetical protein
MSLFGIGSVELNNAGEVVEAQIAEVDPETKQPGHFVNKTAKEIAMMILDGEDVRGLFTVDGSSILGPKFLAVVLSGGRDGIVLEPNDMDWSITDVSWPDGA